MLESRTQAHKLLPSLAPKLAPMKIVSTAGKGFHDIPPLSVVRQRGTGALSSCPSYTDRLLLSHARPLTSVVRPVGI